MKKIIAVVVGTIGLLTSCSTQQDNQFVINGTTDAADGELVLLAYMEGGQTITDTAIVENGAFRFEGSMKNPQLMAIIGSDYSDYQSQKLRRFFAEPGEMSIILSGDDYSEAPITGSINGTIYDEIMGKRKVYSDQSIVLYDSIANNKDNEELIVVLKKQCDSLYTLSNYVLLEGVKDHPNSFVGPVLMSFIPDSFTSLEQKDSIYSAWSADVQAAAVEFKRDLDAMHAITPGHMAPELTGITPQGKEIKLSDFRGNVVLLDFWATWCVPCRKSMPHLREIYEKYNEKGLKVFCVSIDYLSNENEWKEAIVNDKIEAFQHILSGIDIVKDENGNIKELLDKDDQSKLYSIKYIPSKFLIDPEGKMIGRFDKEEELDAKLANIYQ